MTRMNNLEQLLSSEDINGSIIDLDDFISELSSYGEEMDKLTEPQKKFSINQNLEREINNGGFNQYFINSSGDFAHETIDSLISIGARKTAEILQKAIDQFPDKKVPKDRELRISVVEKIEKKANKVWEKLDEQFFEYQDNLNELNIEFVRKNKNEF